MELLFDLEHPLASDSSIGLTIGNFDGFHLGHQFVIESLKAQAPTSAVITFESHPSIILRPEKVVPSILTMQHKIELLKKAGVDHLYLLKFTQEFSQQSPELFLKKVRTAIPFQTLVLGHDAAIGKDREGTYERIQSYADTQHFKSIRLDPFILDERPISSTRIREHIQKGNFSEVSRLLGRPYSIQGTVIYGEGKGKVIGFPTANLQVEGLCLPPKGVYIVQVNHKEQKFHAIANLGTAPTVKVHSPLLLEIHLLDQQEELYGKSIEVIFKSFIRPEQRFDSVKELTAQIEKDIRVAKAFTSQIIR